MNIRHILLACICIPLGLFAEPVVRSPRLSSDDIKALHKSFVGSGEYEEALQAIDTGRNTHDASLEDLREKNLQMLQERFAPSGENSLSSSERELHREIIHAQATGLEQRGQVSPELHKELDGVVNQTEQTWLGKDTNAFFDKHSGNIGLGAYHSIDGYMQMAGGKRFTRGLAGKTPTDVWNGVNHSRSTFDKVAGGVRNVAQSMYGLAPFISKIPFFDDDNSQNQPDKHSVASKVLGAGHLGLRAANLAYHLASSNTHQLTAEQARLLSYYNRRYGVPATIKRLHAERKRRNKIRFALRLLGQGLLPAMLSYTYKGGKDGKVHTSPGLAIANISGAADAVLGIYDRHRTSQAMKTIKKMLPSFARELEVAPPTDQEKQDDRQAAGFAQPDAMQIPGLSL